MSKPHFHKDENGILVRCYHGARNFVLDYKFWIATTLAFPLEHALWTLTPLSHIAEWAGLFGPHAH